MCVILKNKAKLNHAHRLQLWLGSRIALARQWAALATGRGGREEACLALFGVSGQQQVESGNGVD